MASGNRSAFASGLDYTKAEDWLFEYYVKNQRTKALMYETDPFLGNVSKEQIYGKRAIINLKYTRNPNTSKKFNIAQTHARTGSSKRITFIHDYDEDFAVARVENKTIYASNSSQYAFVSLLKDEIDDALEALTERRADDIWANGKGNRGSVKSHTGKVITLSDPTQVTNFDEGDKFEFYSNASSPVKKSAGAVSVFTVSKVSRSRTKPQVTFEETLPTTLANGDDLYKQGDFGQQTMDGIQSLIVHELPSNDSAFGGNDRSVAPERLSGVKGSIGASEDYAEHFRKLAVENRLLVGKVPDTLWINPIRENSFISELGDKVRYNTGDQGMGKGLVGFSGLEVVTPKGNMKVMSSIKVPENRAFGLNMDSFKVKYVSAPGKGFVDFISKDGSKEMLAYDDAGIEVRAESYGALICDAPGCNFVTDLSAKAIS